MESENCGVAVLGLDLDFAWRREACRGYVIGHQDARVELLALSPRHKVVATHLVLRRSKYILLVLISFPRVLCNP